MIHFKLLGMCMSVSDLSPDKHDGRDFSLDFSLRLMCISIIVYKECGFFIIYSVTFELSLSQ